MSSFRDEHFNISGWTFLVHRHGKTCSVTTEDGRPIELDASGLEREFESLEDAVSAARNYVLQAGVER